VVEFERNAGAYEVVVLSGESAASLRDWLADNGFQSLPREAQASVDRCLAEGWAPLRGAVEGAWVRWFRSFLASPTGYFRAPLRGK